MQARMDRMCHGYSNPLRLYWRQGNWCITAEDMDFAYRHSVLHDRRGIVVEATFELQHGERNDISETMAAYKDRRRRTQPLQMACAGSVFRNPPGDHAARLIEAAGLKGIPQLVAHRFPPCMPISLLIPAKRQQRTFHP